MKNQLEVQENYDISTLRLTAVCSASELLNQMALPEEIESPTRALQEHCATYCATTAYLAEDVGVGPPFQVPSLACYRYTTSSKWCVRLVPTQLLLKETGL